MPKSPVVRALCASLLADGGRCHRRRHQARPNPRLLHACPDSTRCSTTTLANGMKVIVWTDRDIPNIALYNWVRVGSRNEVPGITGLAHFFEHMMFNGTAKRTPGEFDRLMEAQGGSNNAFTSDDVTVYQDWIPRTALDLVFDLEADRLANLSFDPKVIESERGVVYSERRLRTEDSNDGFLAEQVQATAFVAHPYQFPTVGWPADIQGWKIEDLQKFFKTNYAPNNCTLILVGDLSRRRRLRAREEIPGADPEAGAAAAGAHRRARADRREARARRSATRRRRCSTTPTSRRRPTTRRARPSICSCPC